ncbi:MAG TPA: NAD-dependent epimerase/dehydratase family protein [Longimicrobiaceae bacterium]|nr:NAD-dependent epimerase/dehydratase family protein [Longimicrobiaceae bacterium]
MPTTTTSTGTRATTCGGSQTPSKVAAGERAARRSSPELSARRRFAPPAGCVIAIESGPDRLRIDRAAIEALLEVAKRDGAPRVLIYTSTTFVLGGASGPADENAPTDPSADYAAARVEHERIVLTASDSRLAAAVIRPGMVFGGAGGMVGALFRTARETGAAEYVGDGENRCPLVHRKDVGRLYRWVAESRGRGIFHAVDGTALRVRDIAAAASRAAGRAGDTRGVPLSEARRMLGGFADALCRGSM